MYAKIFNEKKNSFVCGGKKLTNEGGNKENLHQRVWDIESEIISLI